MTLDDETLAMLGLPEVWSLTLLRMYGENIKLDGSCHRSLHRTPEERKQLQAKLMRDAYEPKPPHKAVCASCGASFEQQGLGRRRKNCQKCVPQRKRK